ncbi:M48 family metalloprotease [Azospirillum thermophilum]|uniref:M48 family metalloprotease n=1 Tax=Azospirillum thermophilum TaxID=2202148 RepID=UPI00143D5887|nr:M48 family metalloprotease [Azospirillum thermophilum]
MDGSRNVAEDRMLREVAEQCRALGIARPPAVHACDPEVFDRGPFAHAGLVDGGRVGIPEPWLHGPTPRALRFVVGHELSHVLHRDGFIHEVVSAFIALFLRLPGTLCAAFVLLLIVVAVPVSAAAVALAAVMAAVVRDAGPLLAVLAAIPEIIVGIPSIPQVKGAATIAVGVACVGGGLVLYRLWVGRRQELKADETALRVAGAEAAHEGIDLIARLEGASGEGPVPLTREHYRGAVVGALTAVAALLLPRGGETHGARLTLAVAAWVGVHVGDVLWRSADALKRLPGAEVVRHGVWRLTRTHPTPAERKRHVERLLAARRYPGAHPSRESVR